jgi:hypothetical protein
MSSTTYIKKDFQTHTGDELAYVNTGHLKVKILFKKEIHTCPRVTA